MMKRCWGGRKHPIFSLRAKLTAVYFPPEQDFLPLRSISACAHQQYCRINWISDHSIIITIWKSVPATQPRSRVKQHLAGVCMEWHYVRSACCHTENRLQLRIPHCRPRLLLKPHEWLPNPRDHCILRISLHHIRSSLCESLSSRVLRVRAGIVFTLSAVVVRGDCTDAGGICSALLYQASL